MLDMVLPSFALPRKEVDHLWDTTPLYIGVALLVWKDTRNQGESQWLKPEKYRAPRTQTYCKVFH